MVATHKKLGTATTSDIEKAHLQPSLLDLRSAESYLENKVGLETLISVQ